LRAVLLRETGGPEQLEVAEVDQPEPAEGQVLVRVRAAGINFLDVLVRQGRYPQMPELPTVPGSEVAGEVDGRRVMALPRGDGGGYAEWVAVDESLLVPLPDGASYEEGAAFLLTFLTVWIPLTRQVRLGEGATVLVHAGAGGVGSAGIQVAKHLGARVVATASSEEKLEVARSLGADEALLYDGFE
jgi:NADPH2:quinone reductase